MKSVFTIILFSFISLLKAQVTDTVVVYEEEVIYDTVFVDKKKELKRREVSFSDKRKQYRKMSVKHIDYGIAIYGGTKNHNLFTQIIDKNNHGFGAGIWFQKEIYLSQLAFTVAINYFGWNKTFELDAEKHQTPLDGFYFSNIGTPVFFQKFSNKHFDISLPASISYTWNNFSPFIGISANYSTFKMQFLVPDNNAFGKLEDFKATKFSLGYMMGLKYNIKNFHFSLEYHQGQFSKLKFKNGETGTLNFRIENGFIEHRFLFGIQYSLKWNNR